MGRRIDTLRGQGYVELLDVFGTELDIVNCARMSFGVQKEAMDESDKRLIRYLLDNRHTSPFEQVSVRLLVEAPLPIVRQWERHRVFRYAHVNEVSRRYTAEGLNLWYLHADDVRGQHATAKQCSGGDIDEGARNGFACLVNEVNIVAEAAYSNAIANNVAREQARALLPQTMMVKFVCTVDLLNLLHWISLRDASDAQGEMAEYARAVRALAAPHFPVTLEHHANVGQIMSAVKKVLAAARRDKLGAAGYARLANQIKEVRRCV